MKIGCSSLLYGGYDLDAALDGMKSAGFDAVELCSIPGMGEHFKGGEPPEVYAAIREKLQAAGLALESVGCSGSLRTERFEPLMRAAAALGAPFITLGGFGVADDEHGWRQVIEAVRAALPLAEEIGVKMSFKPHVRATIYNTKTARRFIEEIQSPLVGLNIDNTHLERSGDDPIAAVNELREWIFTARIRDYKSDDFSVGLIEHQIPGKGAANVRGYYEALTTVPGLEYVVLEMGGTDYSGSGLQTLDSRELQRVVGEALVALRSYGA
ncbi:MAG: sugar phosphate isomerase/epimerase family protein [Armatimonadota bacterium]